MNRQLLLPVAAALSVLATGCSTAPRTTAAIATPVHVVKACSSAKPQQALVINGTDYTSIAGSAVAGLKSAAAGLGIKLSGDGYRPASSAGASLEPCVALETSRPLDRLQGGEPLFLKFEASGTGGFDARSLRVEVDGRSVVPLGLSNATLHSNGLAIQTSALSIGPHVLDVSVSDSQKREVRLLQAVSVIR